MRLEIGQCYAVCHPRGHNRHGPRLLVEYANQFQHVRVSQLPIREDFLTDHLSKEVSQEEKT